MSYRRLTIATPVYNSFERLCRFFPDLLSLDYPRSFIDLVFVDNGSEDETVETLKLFKDRHKHEYASITIDSIPRGNAVESFPRLKKELEGAPFAKWRRRGTTTLYNVVRARNRAIELSPRNNDILFFDDDMTPPSNALKRLALITEPVTDDVTFDIAGGLMVDFIRSRKRHKGHIKSLSNWGFCFNKFPNFKILSKRVQGLSKSKAKKVIEKGLEDYTAVRATIDLNLWKDDLMEVDGVGFGFCLITRRVLDVIKIRFSSRVSEDFLFCLEARLHGFRIILDPNLWIDHWRFKYEKTFTKEGRMIVKYKGLRAKGVTR